MIDIEASAEGLRNWLGSRARMLLAGDRPVPRRQDGDDAGLFGPGSVIWRVHSSSSLLIGGIRALVLQTLHPQAMAGVAEHSDYRSDPWGRLHRTGDFVAATTFGTTAEADTAFRRVRHVHQRVVGIGPDGLPYRANDPHLLAWVHATEVDSLLRAYERYDNGPFGPADQDRYVAEMAVIASRLGVVGPPTDRASLQQYLRGIRGELRGTAMARTTTKFILQAPVPIVARVAYGTLAAAAVGLLPGFVRRELRLALPPGFDTLAAQPSARVVLAGLRWLLTPEAAA